MFGSHVDTVLEVRFSKFFSRFHLLSVWKTFLRGWPTNLRERPFSSSVMRIWPQKPWIRSRTGTRALELYIPDKEHRGGHFLHLDYHNNGGPPDAMLYFISVDCVVLFTRPCYLSVGHAKVKSSHSELFLKMLAG